MRPALETVRFLLELAALVALAVGGASLSWALAILFPVVFVAIWGFFVAPKATHRLADPARLVLELVLFVATGLALVPADRVVLGVAFVVASAAVAVGLRVVGSKA